MLKYIHDYYGGRPSYLSPDDGILIKCGNGIVTGPHRAGDITWNKSTVKEFEKV